jgi:hypothetical protein
LIGGGGITAIVVAWLGTRKPHALNPPETIGIQALLGDRFAIDSLSREIKRTQRQPRRCFANHQSHCDLMDVTRALDRMHRDYK